MNNEAFDNVCEDLRLHHGFGWPSAWWLRGDWVSAIHGWLRSLISYCRKGKGQVISATP